MLSKGDNERMFQAMKVLILNVFRTPYTQSLSDTKLTSTRKKCFAIAPGVVVWTRQRIFDCKHLSNCCCCPNKDRTNGVLVLLAIFKEETRKSVRRKDKGTR